MEQRIKRRGELQRAESEYGKRLSRSVSVTEEEEVMVLREELPG